MSDLELISFLNRLERSDVKLSIEGDNLGVVFSGGQDELLLGEIKQHKSSLLQFLRTASATTIAEHEHEEPKEAYRLAYAQKRIWLHEKLEPGSRAYYIHSEVMVKGSMRSDLLSLAMNKLLLRHEVLRTVFAEQHGHPIQLITPAEDWTGLQETNFNQPYHEKLLDKISAHRRQVHFNLEKGPLFGIHLFRFENDVQILSFSVHHIIADAQSLAVLMTDLIKEYLHLQKGIEMPAGNRFQYRDFCSWEEAQSRSTAFDKDREYWLQQFNEEPTAIALPYKSERKKYKTYNGKVQELTIGKSLTAGMRKFCREQHTTPFIFFYTSLQALLYRYTEQTDLTIGTSVQGRDELAFRDQVGLYASTLPLRLRFAEHASFRQLLDSAKTTVQDALGHHHFPFDLLVEETAFVRDPSRAPFFDIMIDYFPATQPLQVDAMELAPVRFPQTTSKFDLTCTFFDEGENVNLRIEYNTDLFESEFIRKMLSHLLRLMDQSLQFPLAPIQKLQLLDHEEMNRLLCDLGCGPDEMRPFAALSNVFEKTAARWPEREAIVCNGRSITYKELNEQSNKLAHHLKDRVQGGVVGIMLERSELLVIALIGIIKSGAAFLPLDPAAPASYSKHILSDSNACLLITDTQCLPGLMDVYEGEVFAIDVQLDLLDTPAENTENIISTNALAYILYTSGSTGLPKGVEVTQQNIANYIQWATQFYYEGLSATRVPWFTSFTFDLSLTSIFTPLLRGDVLDIYPQRDPRDAFLQVLQSGENFGVMKLTPSHVNVLGMTGAKGLRVQRVIVGGEELLPLHIEILEQASPGVRVFNEYGPTETTVGCTVDEVSKDDITIGVPVANTSIYILNKTGELMPEGCWGEIAVGGAGVAKGYCNRVDLTAAKFVQDEFVGSGKMYRTGDIGKWLPDGRLAYRGRADEQVKINGFRIELGEIETALQQVQGIEKATVLVQQGPVKTITAFFTGDSSLDGTSLRAKLADKLPAYILPTKYIFVDVWPLTVNGKTNKQELLQLAAAGRNVQVRMPETSNEKALASFFEELLGVDGIGLDENLFSVGLDSLRVIRAQTLLEEKYPGRVQVHDIFSQSTIAKLCEHIHGPVVTQEMHEEIIDF